MLRASEYDAGCSEARAARQVSIVPDEGAGGFKGYAVLKRFAYWDGGTTQLIVFNGTIKGV